METLLPFVPEMSLDAPVDGRDYVQRDLMPGVLPKIYFPQDRPDPVLAELRAAYEKRQAAQAPQPAPAPEAPGMVPQAASPSDPTGPAPVPAAPVAAPATPVGSSAEEQQGHLTALDQQRKAEMDLMRREGVAKVDDAVRRGRELDQYQRDMATLETERKTAIDGQIQRVRQITDEARNTKIDPGRLFKNASTFQKVASFFAVALGGTLRSTNGGRNPALDLIQKKIEQDINAQETDLDNLKDVAGMERSILGDLRQQFGDRQAARSAMHVIALDQATNELNKALAGLSDPKAIARGAELQAQIGALRAGYAKDAENATAQATQQKIENGLARERLKLERDRLKEDARQFDAKLGAEASERLAAEQRNQDAIDPLVIVGAQRLTDEPGSTDRARVVDGTDPTTVRDLHSVVAAGRNIQQLLADIEELGTNRNLVPDEQKRMANQAMAGIRLYKQQLIKGAASEKDAKEIEIATGIRDPHEFVAWLNAGERARVLQYTANAELRGTNELLRTRNLKLAPIVKTPVSGEASKLERNPDLKITDLGKASEEQPVVQPKRVGDTARGFSPKAQEALNMAKTAPENIRSPAEVRKMRKALQADALRITEKMRTEKDPDKLEQHKNNLQALQVADYTLGQTEMNLAEPPPPEVKATIDGLRWRPVFR